MSASLAILLAAGRSTRMKSATPKVLHPVCGRLMIDWVLDAVREAGVEHTCVVIGHEAERVRSALEHHPDVSFAYQTEQLGTGHAVMMCEEVLTGHEGSVLVLAGDTPLLKGSSLRGLLDEQEAGAACVIGTATTADNQGLGRVVRGDDGQFVKIVEEKDASEQERRIEEINTGCYAFSGPALLSSLKRLKPENAQAEYYLTDCPAILLSDGEKVVAADRLTITEAMGVNTRVQLAAVSSEIQRDIHLDLMASGVTIVSPETTTIEAGVSIGSDTTIHPGTVIERHADIGGGCVVGPHAVIRSGAIIPEGDRVEPFHLREAED